MAAANAPFALVGRLSSPAARALGRENPPALHGIRGAGKQGQLRRRASQPERRQQPAGQRRAAPPAPRRIRRLSVRAGGPDVANADDAADAGHDGPAVRRHGGVPHDTPLAGGGGRGAAHAVGHRGGREGGEDAVRHAGAVAGGGEGDGGGRHARHPRRAQKEAGEGQGDGAGGQGQGDGWWKERSVSSYDMRLALPDVCDKSQVRAELKDGVLLVTVPKTETERKVIDVHVQ